MVKKFTSTITWRYENFHFLIFIFYILFSYCCKYISFFIYFPILNEVEVEYLKMELC